MNGCITCTSFGVYEWLLHMCIYWCMWTAALHVHLLVIWTAVLHVHLLVYVNGCFTRTSVGVCACVRERLLHTYTRWCVWTTALRIHLLVIWTAVSHVHLLVYMNGCFTCTSVAAFRDHNSITTHLVSSQTLWTTKYNHTSCIITNSIWTLQYHHTLSIFTKALYGP